ncbi:MAG: DMT family transporter [Alphaproteobacteria bacterium]|nr:DMT family transporter [Alphaproteobacteria bacterium]
MQWLLSPVAILAGMLMVVQSACNGMLEKVIDRPVIVGVISLGTGISTLLTVGIVLGQLGLPTSGKALEAPWWAWLGGVCGAMALLSQPIAVPRLGAAMYVGLFVTASTVLSVIFDHFAWLGLSQHPAGIGRVVGCALMVIGIGLVSLF